jgi:hypothetical protein
MSKILANVTARLEVAADNNKAFYDMVRPLILKLTKDCERAGVPNEWLQEYFQHQVKDAAHKVRSVGDTGNAMKRFNAMTVQSIKTLYQKTKG